MAAETSPTSYYGNLPKFLVSYLKSMYGAAATAENDFGYDWHPKILGDHSHIATFAAMADGKVKGMCCVGQNPATSLNGGGSRDAPRPPGRGRFQGHQRPRVGTHRSLCPVVGHRAVNVLGGHTSELPLAL